jgi:peroxiredoxin/mono/diheme cytochrome c family protein
MIRHGSLWTIITLAALVVASDVRSDESPLDRGIGQTVPDFTLTDTSGKAVRLYSYAGKKAVVVVVIGTNCPVSDLYLPRLAELARKYEKSGVAFVALDSDSGAEAAKVAEHTKKQGVTFPVLMDRGNVAADVLMAERTCEALVIDGQARLRYRGSIDDQFATRARKTQPEKTYLVDALDRVVAGEAVKLPATPVAGRPIERVKVAVKAGNGPRVRASTLENPAAARVKTSEVGPVNYAADVAPIVQKKCQECHRPGQVAPFPLLTYEHVQKHSKTIREVVEERRMPPWHADPRYGHFSNDRSLSPRERAVILAWIDQDTPSGDAKDAPAPKDYPQGWEIGKPDFVFEMPHPFTVAADGVLPYQYFRVPTGFKQDTWIQAAEARPGDRSIVHHILVQVDDHKGGHGSGDAPDEYLVAYAPGDYPAIYRPGTAKLIPAGSDLIFQVHYTPIGRAKVDCSSVGLVVAKTPVKHRAVTIGIAQRQFEIPAGDENHVVEATFTFPREATLLSLFPHMHLRGKSFQYTAVYPDGKKEVLLSVPAYDFGWQSVYRLAEPKKLPKGTRIDCLARFDNSAKNPANPDPTTTVRWGDQTFEEMMIGYLDCIAAPPAENVARVPTTTSAVRPVGIWKSASGQPPTEIKITDEGFELSLSLPANRLAFDADITTTKDGALFGRVRKVKLGEGPVADDVFGFRYEVSNDTLQISTWKGSGIMAQGVILEGKYERIAPKTKGK